MQSRARPGREHDIVRVALALQKHEQQVLGAVGGNIFGQPEAHAHPELARLLHVGHQQLEMIEPLRHRAMVMLERDDEARLDLHGGAELDRGTAGVADVERAALVRNLDPFRRQAGLLKKRLGLLQVLLGEDAHPDALGLRRAPCALEHETVVAGLGNAAQIERVLVLVADDEAEQVHVEISGDREVLDRQHGMAGARDVEGRVVDCLRNAHGALPATMANGRRSSLSTRTIPMSKSGCATTTRGRSVCVSAATHRTPALSEGGGLETVVARARSGCRGRRSAQKLSTASVTAALMRAWRSCELITNSSSRLMIEPASSRTAGICVFRSTISWSYR